MDKDFIEIMRAAGANVIDLSEEADGIVVCDICNKDYTFSKESGGFVFVSTAVCPDCADKFLKGVKHHKEEKYIRGFCPEDISFADWIRKEFRKGE